MSQKTRPSKLDQYAETLLDMDDQKTTLAEIQAWLKHEGVTVSTGRLSEFLAGLRSSRQQQQLLSQISSGAKQCAEVEKAFGENPAPELDTLIKLQRVILLNLSTQATANPEMLDLISNSFRAVMDSEKLNLKRAELAQNERKLKLLEAKAAAFDQAKDVITSKLSPEEQKKRLKEILK